MMGGFDTNTMLFMGPLLWIVFLIGLFYILAKLADKNNQGNVKSSIEILKKKLAERKITEEEFKVKRELIKE